MNDTPRDLAPTDTFSLVRGGPFYRACLRIGLVKRDNSGAWRLPLFAFAVAFVPFAALALIEMLAHGRLPRLAHEVSVHARLALAIPAFCAAEPVVDVFTRRASARLFASGMVPHGETEIRRVEAWGVRLRDSRIAEIALAVLGFGLAQAILAGLGPFRDATQTVAASEWSAARLWYGYVGLPLFLFLAFRWLWRWVIWASLLARLSRLPLRLEPLHPDRAGGVGLVSEVSASFAPVVFGLSCVASGAWASRILYLDVPLTTFKADLALLVATFLLFTFGPLVVLAPHLTRARLRAREDVSRLSLQFLRAFRPHFIRPTPADDLLDTGSLEGLASLHEIADRVARMRGLPISRRAVLIVVGATLLPVLPLLLTTFSLMELATRVGHAMVGTLA